MKKILRFKGAYILFRGNQFLKAGQPGLVMEYPFSLSEASNQISLMKWILDIINFNADKGEATVYTANPAWIM